MITDQQFQRWLVDGGRRVILVEVQTDSPKHLSNVAYCTLPNDTPANKVYRPCVATGFAFSERLSLDGNPSVSAGTVEIHNEDASFDSWLDEVWVNRGIQIYIGDLTWGRSDFRLIFSGVVAKLDSPSTNRLAIVMRDKLERLNTPATEATLGGTTDNKDRLLPVTLGECHNIEPLLVDPSQHEYQWHTGAAERLIEVRDNGVPLTAVTTTLATGKFKLGATPAGTVTCSVQGATPYTNTIPGVIKNLVKNYGTPSERFTDADLDLTNLSQFEAANPAPVGVYIGDRTNVLQICQDLAASKGAQVIMSRRGKLRLIKVDLSSLSNPVKIQPQDYEAKSLSIKERSEVIAGVKLGYCKNWTTQDSLDTGIPPENKEMFSQEWLTVTQKDSAVAGTYRLYAEPEQKDTLLLVESDANAEATRRLNLWKTQRTVYSIKGYAQCLTLELGQAVTLYGDRFGLTTGKTGMIIGLQLDWMQGRATVEVLV